MFLVVKVLSSTESGLVPLGEKVPFIFDETKSRWIAAHSVIEIPHEAVIGVHAVCEAEAAKLHLTFVHESEILADFFFQLSDTQSVMFRFSNRFMIATSVEK